MVLDTEYHRKVMVLHLRSSQSQPFVFFTTHTYACPHGCKLSIRLSWCCYCPSNCLAFARPIATHPVFFIFSNHTGSQRRLVLLAVRAWSGVPTPTQQNTDSRSRTPPVRAFRNAIGVDSGILDVTADRLWTYAHRFSGCLICGWVAVRCCAGRRQLLPSPRSTDALAWLPGACHGTGGCSSGRVTD